MPEDEGYYCSCGRFVVDSFCEECQAADELEACSGTPEHECALLFEALILLPDIDNDTLIEELGNRLNLQRLESQELMALAEQELT